MPLPTASTTAKKPLPHRRKDRLPGSATMLEPSPDRQPPSVTQQASASRIERVRWNQRSAAASSRNREAQEHVDKMRALRREKQSTSNPSPRHRKLQYMQQRHEQRRQKAPSPTTVALEQRRYLQQQQQQQHQQQPQYQQYYRQNAFARRRGAAIVSQSFDDDDDDDSTYLSSVQQRSSHQDDETYDYGQDEATATSVTSSLEDDDFSQVSSVRGNEPSRMHSRSQHRRTTEGNILKNNKKSSSDGSSHHRRQRTTTTSNHNTSSDDDHPFLQASDLAHYRAWLETPGGQAATAIVSAAAVGCIVAGTAGVWVGAAAVGVGIGVWQIPPPQRRVLVESATESIQQTATTVGNSCYSACQGGGQGGMEEVESYALTEACFGSPPEEQPPPPQQQQQQQNDDVHADALLNTTTDTQHTYLTMNTTDLPKSFSAATTTDDGGLPHAPSLPRNTTSLYLPGAQIYALEPSAQPKAWLAVLQHSTQASELHEALQELEILAKDKDCARQLVDDHVLSILLDLTRHQPPHTRAAATVLVLLGKTYCAAHHTEGSLLLMSMFENAKVPVERQVAQMIHETQGLALPAAQELAEQLVEESQSGESVFQTWDGGCESRRLVMHVQ